MTISTTASRADYSGNGVTTAFAVPFVFFGPDELTVLERVTATGAETTLVRGTHYSVSGGNGATGTVTATTAPPTGRQWTIIRTTAPLQQIDYTRNDPFPAESVERGLDRLTAIVQEVKQDVDRALRMAATDTTAVTLPPSVQRANSLLGFDGTGNAVAVPTTSGGALGFPVEIGVACSDETTPLTTGTAKVTFRIPRAMTLTAVRASLRTASSSGVVEIDVNEGGVSIFSTRLTIDAGERTSVTAAAPAVISDTVLADDAEMTVDIDAAGTGAVGLKLWLLGVRAP